MHIHILGICGTFMGGIAAIAREAGHTVTGCDANVYPPMSDQLRALGIDLIEGFDADQIKLNPDIYVVGNTVSRGKHPLMEEILDRGLPYTSGPQWLAENILHPQGVSAKTNAPDGALRRSQNVQQNKWVLAAAGTHGKTTTASMLAWILEHAGMTPGFLIGGVPSNFSVSARLGETPFFVIEADEYDTAFFDKRSKFVHYRPRTAILNNLEFDHADIFADLAAIETQFHHLVRTVPGNGLVIVNSGEESLQRVLARGCWSPVEWFGNTPSPLAPLPRGGEGSKGGWTAKGGDSDFEVLLAGEKQGRVQWDLMGEHNRMNALAAIAAARHAGVAPAVACEALGLFKNVKRRMEVKGVVNGITVYDDFAHHPTAIETTLGGLRARVGKQARIIAVLEPRSNTMKMGTLKNQLPASLRDADCVFVYTHDLGWDAGPVFNGQVATLHLVEELPVLVDTIKHEAKPGDHVLIMSNGGFGGIHQKLLDALAQPLNV
jgi:UDP-N-acetylmuramate: L-alanyl-gamma-D-glutamyl-meso-diaminopimelate ligase